MDETMYCDIQFCNGAAEYHIQLKDAALDIRFCWQHTKALGQVPFEHLVSIYDDSPRTKEQVQHG